MKALLPVTEKLTIKQAENIITKAYKTGEITFNTAREAQRKVMTVSCKRSRASLVRVRFGILTDYTGEVEGA